MTSNSVIAAETDAHLTEDEYRKQAEQAIKESEETGPGVDREFSERQYQRF